MVTLSMGLQHLRLSDFLEENHEPSKEERDRLQRGSDFLRRILTALTYFEEGQAAGLEEAALAEVRYVRATEKKLREAAGTPETHKYLSHLQAELSNFIENGELNADSRNQLARFFEWVGEAMITEELENVPKDEADATRTWSSLEECFA